MANVIDGKVEEIDVKLKIAKTTLLLKGLMFVNLSISAGAAACMQVTFCRDNAHYDLLACFR
jgi:hypothetical protein